MFIKQLLEFNSSRVRLYEVNQKFAEAIPIGATVLDAGAGEAPYKVLLKHANYESADFEMVDKVYARSTYVCDLKEIPVEDRRYDFVLFNQVMEHLPDPRSVLLELFRVMKPGARLLYTAPLFYEEHEQPYDFYRYTSFGIHHMFSGTGFIVEKIDWLEGYYGTIGYQMNRMHAYMPRRPSLIAKGLLGWLLSPVMILVKIQMGVLSILFHWLEIKSKYTRAGYPKNYVAIVRRPE